eukprot:6935672-Pyramimonas_sp.AAC.1
MPERCLRDAREMPERCLSGPDGGGEGRPGNGDAVPHGAHSAAHGAALQIRARQPQGPCGGGGLGRHRAGAPPI